MDIRWGLVILVTALVVLHFVLRIGYGLGDLAPDFLVIALLITARFTRAGAASGVGFLLGFLEGSMVPLAMGLTALSLTVLGYLGARVRNLFSDDNVVYLALYFFLGKWLYDALLFLLTGARPAYATDLLVLSPLAGIYAAAVGLLALAAYRWVT